MRERWRQAGGGYQVEAGRQPQRPFDRKLIVKERFVGLIKCSWLRGRDPLVHAPERMHLANTSVLLGGSSQGRALAPAPKARGRGLLLAAGAAAAGAFLWAAHHRPATLGSFQQKTAARRCGGGWWRLGVTLPPAALNRPTCGAARALCLCPLLPRQFASDNPGPSLQTAQGQSAGG